MSTQYRTHAKWWGVIAGDARRKRALSPHDFRHFLHFPPWDRTGCLKQWELDKGRERKTMDLMPDKRGRELTGHVARPRCCRVCKISVFDAVLRHFYFPFFPTFEIVFFEKKRERVTQFSFFCMPTTVSGSNSWSFAIIGDQSLEVWQHALRISDWRSGPTQPNLPSSSSLLFFFFFACFLIFLKKAFSERKIALEIFPKKDEGALQITVQSMTNATFDTVRQVRKAIFACLTIDWKMPLPLLSCTSLLSSSSSEGEGCLSLLEKIPKGNLAISKTYPELEFFFCQPCWVRKPVFFLFVNLFRFDCQIANEGTLLPQR